MWRWILLVLTVISMDAARARADEPADRARHRDEARELAEQGLAQLDAGDARAAIVLLERAEEKFHAPTHLLYLARAHAVVGEDVAAAQLYARLVNEALPDYAPDPFREAQRLAGVELAAVSRRVGTVRITGAGFEALAVDGARASGAVLYVTPGRHVVSAATRSGRIERTVDISAGGVTTVDLTPPPASPARTGRDSSGVPDDGGPRPLLLAGIITMAIGGAATVAGAVTGGLSLVKVDQLDDRCPTKRGCPAEDEPIADQARALGNASTALLAIGGSAVVTGLVLALVPDGPPEPVAATIRIWPRLGPGSAAVQIDF